MLAAWSPYEVGGEAARTAKSTLTATEVGDATITLTSGEGEDIHEALRRIRADVANGRFRPPAHSHRAYVLTNDPVSD
jgi:hypothetical protein